MLNESTFKKNLIKWFNENQREMPWRETSNPYYIWLSEVIFNKHKLKPLLTTITSLLAVFQL